MFIQVKRSGYTSGGQQFCSGLFLILTQPKWESTKYPHKSQLCQTCGKPEAAHHEPLPQDIQELSDKMHRIWKHLFNAKIAGAKDSIEDIKDAVEIILNAKSKVEGCRYFVAQSITYPIRAIVRHVAMQQLGQFMMGYARVHGYRLTLSGSYGSDGLPDTVPDTVYEQGLELPQYLRDLWSNGGGWNSTGSESREMRKWALEHLKELRA